MSEGRERQTQEYRTVSLAEWREIVEKGLKGASFEKALMTRMLEGISIPPLFTREDQLAEGDGSGFPGFAPFTRATSAVGSDGSGWEIRQAHRHPDWKVTRCAIRDEIERGGDSIELVFDAATRAGLDTDTDGVEIGDGLLASSADQITALFHCSDIDAVPVSLGAGSSGSAVGALWVAAAQEKGVAADSLRACFNCDPLAALASDGELQAGLATSFAEMSDAAAWAVAEAPGIRACGVSTQPYHDAGASVTQELAYALATAVSYLRKLEEAGLSVEAAAGQLQFEFCVGRDFFLEIAKLRAARLLWCKIFVASGGDPSAFSMAIHARTSARTQTARDPWVNMLRGTVESFAAGVGGADSLATAPFDSLLGLPNDFSRRIATNTQVLLKEETHLKRVIDPAGGSWYVEALTDQLARAAWREFQEIEAQGGMAEALLSGSIASQVAGVAAAMGAAVAKRKEAITGVSEFPNLHEDPVAKEAVDLDAIRATAQEGLASLRKARDEEALRSKLEALAAAFAEGKPGSCMTAAIEAASAGATLSELVAQRPSAEPARIEPLQAERLAAGFEALRDASDEAQAKDGKRPQIFLANLGPIPKHKARSTFAQNLVEAGGIEALDNDGFMSGEEAAKAFGESDARAAVICSADDVYEDLAVETASQLRRAGAQWVLLAGRAGDQEAVYREAGVDGFIYMGVDVLETLRTLQAEIGVSK